MSLVPVYVKKKENDPRPTDPTFYWITGSGVYLCRNTQMLTSDVRVDRFPKSLARHRNQCLLNLPRLPQAGLEFVVGFFSRIFDLYQSESIILLFWHPQKKRYKLVVPDQTASVWQTSTGYRTPMDVQYEIPVKYLGQYLLLGDIHSHGDMSSYTSHTDQVDETHRDGFHAVVGNIDREPPSFHIEVSIDGSRFALPFAAIFKGYDRRRPIVPQKWIEKVQIKVSGPVVFANQWFRR